MENNVETQKQIAIFGGTFDPPTLAHEAIIRNCLEDTRYDEVWLMPSGERTDKVHMHSETLRMDLLQRVHRDVFANDSRLRITDFELQLPLPTETVHTYEALRASYPNTQFWFVYGADSIAHMPDWYRGNYLREQLAIVAVPRCGFSLPPESEQLRYVMHDPLYDQDISSTNVRKRIAAHKQYQHMVSRAVAAEIEKSHLYADVC